MVEINGVKYACKTCKTGHRSGLCMHTERQLLAIKPKGRPITQCSHCRELRKKKKHVKCIHVTKPLNDEEHVKQHLLEYNNILIPKQPYELHQLNDAVCSTVKATNGESFETCNESTVLSKPNESIPSSTRPDVEVFCCDFDI